MRPRLRSGFRWGAVALVLALLAGTVPAEPQAPEKKNTQFAEPLAKGQRVFSCGHSFHAGFAPMLEETARSAGFKITALNRLLQELAWDAVVRHPLGGVRAEEHRGHGPGIGCGTTDSTMFRGIDQVG